MNDIRIHLYTAGPQGAFVNAYLVESSDGIVAIDGTLTVSDGRALRAQRESLEKPLLAVLVTHAHPDHYGGIVELVGDDAVQVIATEGVAAVIRRDDAIKEEILRPMFGDEMGNATDVPEPDGHRRRAARARRSAVHRRRPRPGRVPARQHLAAR